MPNLVDHALRWMGHSRAPGAHRLVNRLRPAGRVSTRDAAFHARFDGLDYAGSLSEHIDREIFYFGAYAPGELSFLDYAAKALERPGGINFYDIGANVGQHSLWMSKRAARVIAFEPSAAAVRQLQGNLARNAIDNVRLFPFALGDQDMEASLGSGLPNNAGSRSLTWTLDDQAVETVAVRQGEAVFRDHDLPPIHLLKIDVEGFEKKVLSGLAPRLAQDRPVIMMELVGPTDNKSGFASEADLRGSLYPDHQLFSIAGGRDWRLRPFDWEVEELVCVPAELAQRFSSLALK